MLSKNIIYFGPNIKGSTTEKRIKSLKELKYNVNIIDSSRYYQIRKSVLKAIQIRVGFGPVYKKTLTAVLKEINKFKPKYLIIEIGYLFNINSLYKIKEKYPQLKLIFLTVDSIKTRTFQKSFFLKTLSLYNFIVTTKSSDIEIYKKYRAKKIIFSYQGIDEKNFFDYALSINENHLKSEVVFIGDYGKDRANTIKFLIEANVPIKIFGFNWNRYKFFKTFYFGPAMADDYYKILNNTKIALGFLNKEVGDTYTTRSLEIPAAGALLIAEETEDHKKLFKENKEAVFFKNKNELLEKIKYYLLNNEKRKEIAKSGRNRMKQHDLTWKSNIKKIFFELENNTN
ncbi:glycosyltransferase [Candidatus Pelagibacter sp.]|nr:glycosyltransferase [Candidatus Pelagibacter sp.]